MTQDVEKILLTEEQISTLCARIAKQIENDFAASSKKLILVCILKGSLPFTAELMKHISLPLELEFMKVSSYGANSISSGVINLHLDIHRDDLSDADIIVVEDIVDSGRTLSYLVRYLTERGANSVRTCTLLDKPDRRTVHLVPDYCGQVIEDHFVIGFGLDYNEKYRNLPYIGILKPSVYGG